MKFTYYPGCSLNDGTGRAYGESMLAVFKALDIEVKQLEDWNCCGATAYMAIDEEKAFALAARNLALAERQESEIVAPCSACHLVLQKTKRYMSEYPAVCKKIQKSLKNAGLDYSGKAQIRHPLDILVNDVGLDVISKKVKKPLHGLKVAPYYGCQIVRPYAFFDDQTNPVLMDKLFESLGAEVVRYPLKTKCCGASFTGTMPDVGKRLVYILLKEAQKRGADLIAVICPLCQFNLDAYQDKISSAYEKISMPVVYFTQLMGLAFGLDWKELGLGRCMVSARQVLAEKELEKV